jgi:2-polyprenyl-3-methyl-5-hydroxy-6-metoxy-1,4-benzoquinol methylase
MCAATFLEPSQRPSPEVESSYYRLHRNAVDDAGYRGFLSRLVGPLLERIAPGSSGLDFGCGPGPALAAMLAEAGQRVALYDPLFYPDPAVLAHAYDFVTCTETIEHFHRPRQEFERLDALLKPGAWLAIMTKFQTDDAAFAGWHYRRDPTHVVFYREATLRTVAARHGWRCEIPRRDVALLQKPPR